MKLALALLAGVMFAVGLVISDMVSPSRIQGFLDITGDWDPTLAFVMAGAIAVYAPAARLVRDMQWPAKTPIDLRLVGGAAIFGVGWGLSGYCPGPALVSIGASIDTGIFVIAMIAGMAVARRLITSP